MNIDELQVGPELNQLVAERVMGWKRHNWAEHGTLVNTIYCAECGATENKGAEKRASVFCYHFDSDIPSYSVDIAAAWAVVERMPYIPPQRTYCMSAGYSMGRRSKAAVCADRGRLWRAQAETAPLAICRAALKAVGVDKVQATVV